VVSDHGFKSGDIRMAESSDFHAKTGAQWHRQYGVFYAWGNGVKRGASVGGASVYDITPTVLASMGYPVSEEMRRGRGVDPARVLEEAFEGGLPFETRCRRGAASLRRDEGRGHARRRRRADRAHAQEERPPPQARGARLHGRRPLQPGHDGG
jgi:arylsulfatase A-like enzyme